MVRSDGQSQVEAACVQYNVEPTVPSIRLADMKESRSTAVSQNETLFSEKWR